MKKLVSEASKDHSRRLRQEMTDAERKLWMGLNNRQVEGVKFRRQVPLGPYIADFVSHEGRLVIELDGGQHADRVDHDARRTAFLEGEGYRVLRFWNHDVLGNAEGVMKQIMITLADRSGAKRGH